MSWPDFFPECCPPEDSDEAQGEIYRLVYGNKPIESSFICHKLLYPQKKFPNVCMACGLSISKTQVDVITSRKRVPSLKHRKIVVAKLEDKIGNIKNTSTRQMKNHYTWWIPEDVECPWNHFVDIEDY